MIEQSRSDRVTRADLPSIGAKLPIVGNKQQLVFVPTGGEAHDISGEIEHITFGHVKYKVADHIVAEDHDVVIITPSSLTSFQENPIAKPMLPSMVGSIQVTTSMDIHLKIYSACLMSTSRSKITPKDT